MPTELHGIVLDLTRVKQGCPPSPFTVGRYHLKLVPMRLPLGVDK